MTCSFLNFEINNFEFNIKLICKISKETFLKPNMGDLLGRNCPTTQPSRFSEKTFQPSCGGAP